MKNSIIVILLGLILISSCTSLDGTEYQVKFGYLVTDNGETFSFLKESSVIPLLPISMGAYYGIQIQPSHALEYDIEIKVHMPNGNSVALPKYKGKGIKVIPMGFDANDSEGEYKLDISFGDQKQKLIIFNALTEDSLLEKSK